MVFSGDFQRISSVARNGKSRRADVVHVFIASVGQGMDSSGEKLVVGGDKIA